MIITHRADDVFEPNVEFKRFPDNDMYIRILGSGDTVITRLYPEQDSALIEAVFIARKNRENGVETKLVAPYLPYSRQDKLWKEGEVLSARYVVEMLRDAGVAEIKTLDCHFIKKEGVYEYWGVKIHNISASEKLIAEIKKTIDNPIIMSPDAGASYMSKKFGGKHMKKIRGEYIEDDKNAYRKIAELKMADVDVSGKNVVLIDDIIGSGGTMLRAIDNLRKNGASKIGVAATHGFFLKNSLKKLQDAADVIVTTNSVPNPTAKVNAFDLLI